MAAAVGPQPIRPCCHYGSCPVPGFHRSDEVARQEYDLAEGSYGLGPRCPRSRSRDNSSWSEEPCNFQYCFPVDDFVGLSD